MLMDYGSGYTAGNIAAPYTVLTPELPVKYRTTWITLICAMCATMALSLCLRAYFVWENKRRDREASSGQSLRDPDSEKDKEIEPSQPQSTVHSTENLLLSDRQDRSFRYSY